MNPFLALLLLLGLPILSAPIIYLVGRLAFRKNGSAAPARWLALAVLLFEFVPLYFVYAIIPQYNGIEMNFGQIPVRFDGVSLLMTVVVLALGVFVTLFSSTYMAKNVGEEKFYAMLVVMIGAIIGLSAAGDLFNLWVWFELMAVSSYLLVAFYREERDALEAGVKYLVQSAAGSILVLLGISIVFLHTTQLDLYNLYQIAVYAPSPLLLAGGAFLVIGFGVKAALVPLHTWLPDAHSQAPSGISAMLSGIVIEAGLVAMLRSIGGFGASSSAWGPLLLGFGALNMLVGNLMALRQTQIKRLLAYSSVANVGYILLGIGIAVTFQQGGGAYGGFFHLANHALMKGLAFLAAGTLLYALNLSRHSHAPLTISDLDGAARRYPLTALAFSIALLALGGLPPLAGFMSKWTIFVSGFATQNLAIILLVIFAALMSVVSLAYYAPIINRMYRRQPSEAVLDGSPITWNMAVPMVVMTLAVVAIGFWPSLVDWLAGPAAMAVLRVFGGF